MADAVTWSRRGARPRTSRTSGDVAAARRASAGRLASARAAAASASVRASCGDRVPGVPSTPGRGTASARTRSKRRTPSASMRSTSTPAAIFTVASCAQVPYGSLHASTRSDQSPRESGCSAARKRSRPGATSTIRAVRSAPSGATRTAVAATASCPSRNTVASTGTISPTTAFAGHRPPSTTGDTSSTGMRPIGADGAGRGEVAGVRCGAGAGGVDVTRTTYRGPRGAGTWERGSARRTSVPAGGAHRGETSCKRYVRVTARGCAAARAPVVSSP